MFRNTGAAQDKKYCEHRTASQVSYGVLVIRFMGPRRDAWPACLESTFARSIVGKHVRISKCWIFTTRNHHQQIVEILEMVDRARQDRFCRYRDKQPEGEAADERDERREKERSKKSNPSELRRVE